MTAAVLLASVFAEWWAWIVEFYELNIDRWISAGWVVLGILTALASIGMVGKIIKSHKELTP